MLATDTVQRHGQFISPGLGGVIFHSLKLLKTVRHEYWKTVGISDHLTENHLKASCVGWLQETYTLHRENKMLKSKLADVEGAIPKGMER